MSTPAKIRMGRATGSQPERWRDVAPHAVRAVRRHMTAVLCTLGLAGCSSFAAVDESQVHGTLVLSRANGSVSQAVIGPYVSVIDSVALSVTGGPGGTPQLIGRHLTPADTAVTIPLTVQAGSATFSVTILSNNRTVLYDGTLTTTVDRDGFAATVPLNVRRPVLVGIPDLQTASGLDLQTQRRIAKIAVHNSGNGTLGWSVNSLDTAFVRCNQVPGRAPQCLALPTSGSVPPNGNDTLTVSFPDRAVTGAPFFSAHIFSFVLRSTEGDVTVRWQYP